MVLFYIVFQASAVQGLPFSGFISLYLQTFCRTSLTGDRSVVRPVSTQH